MLDIPHAVAYDPARDQIVSPMVKKKPPRAPARPAPKKLPFPRLHVRRFGPIEECELPVRELTVLIGEQASGKSTLAKLVHFFESLPELIAENGARLAIGEPLKNFEKLVRGRIQDCFGSVPQTGETLIEYDYWQKIRMRISGDPKTGYFQVHLSPLLQQEVAHRIKAELLVKRSRRTRGLLEPQDPLSSGHDLFWDQLKFELMLHAPATCVFVPASRSLLSLLSTDLLLGHAGAVDPMMVQFARLVRRLRLMSGASMEKQIADEIHASVREQPVEVPRAQAAIRLAERILRGRYVFEGGDESLVIPGGGRIPLRFASSGQQEAVWIVLLLFWLILDGVHSTVVLEELEAHLYPFAQRHLTELLVLCTNAVGLSESRNAAVLTTHSPYVLTALNNLIRAHQVGSQSKKKGKQVGKIIDPQLWLDPAHVGAWFVENGALRSIIDPELNLIRAEEIDGVSAALNADFDAIEALDRA